MIGMALDDKPEGTGCATGKETKAARASGKDLLLGLRLPVWGMSSWPSMLSGTPLTKETTQQAGGKQPLQP